MGDKADDRTVRALVVPALGILDRVALGHSPAAVQSDGKTVTVTGPAVSIGTKGPLGDDIV